MEELRAGEEHNQPLRLYDLGDSDHRHFSPGLEGQLIPLCPSAWVPGALFIVNWWDF